jgi:hypothetical protein
MHELVDFTNNPLTDLHNIRKYESVFNAILTVAT